MSQSVAAKPSPLSSNVRLIGRYTVQRELRRDRYTAVYLASDPVLNRQLIVKAVQLHPAEGQDRTAHERIEQAFMRQAQAAGRLHHPHIVTVFDAGHVNRLGYLALEKVDGKLLDELLAEGYKPGHLQAADIVARVADAVEFAHARAIPHGHLSPSRIYLQGPERLPKVTGFGGWIDSGMTGDFELHGTDSILPFFGDELAGEARRKDVRALGALLYLLLTGTRPDVKTLRAQRKGAESPILLLRPTTPLALAEIAEQALELGGSRVYTTAGQVRNALTTYLWGNRGGLPLPGSPTITGMPARLAVMPKQPATLTVATVVTPVAAEARRAPRGSWRRHAIAVGFGIVAVLLIAGIWMRGSAPFIGTTATPALPAAGTLPSSTSTVAPSPVSATPAGPAPENAGSDATRAVPLVAGAAPAHNAAPRGAAAAGQGIVALAVSPWGSVFVNGEPRGTTPPLNQITLPAGRHAIEIRNGNQAPYVAQVDVTPERPQQLRHRFE